MLMGRNAAVGLKTTLAADLGSLKSQPVVIAQDVFEIVGTEGEWANHSVGIMLRKAPPFL